METLLGVWKGYSDDALTCEYLLIKAMGSSLVAAVEEEYIKKKFGCTWGMCTDRWLSPRMRFQLLGGHYIIMRGIITLELMLPFSVRSFVRI